MKENKIIKVFLVFLISLIFNIEVFAQNKTIIINDKFTGTELAELQSDYVSLLMASNTRGQLIPRLTYSNMMDISDPADGLLVYVIDVQGSGKEEGFWFYDSYLGVWRRLMHTEDKGDLTEPKGTIVAYTGPITGVNSLFDETGLGKLGTEMQRWALCNGRNGTPDLSMRFMVGGDDSEDTEKTVDEYKYIGSQQPEEDFTINKYSEKDKNQFYVQADQIPVHKHKAVESKLMDFNHTHSIVKPQHQHSFTAAYGFFSGDEQDGRPTKGSGKMTFPCDLVDAENISFDTKTIWVSVQLPKNCLLPYGEQKDKIDNRPPTYAVAYIMKVEWKPYAPESRPSSGDAVKHELYTKGNSGQYLAK